MNKIQASKSPLAEAIKKRVDVSTVPPWIKKLTPQDVEAALSGISDMVDNGYFDTEEMYFVFCKRILPFCYTIECLFSSTITKI